MGKLQGKVIVVIGGSRGIGLAIAKVCGREDAQLVLVARDRGPLLGIDAQTGEPRGEFDPGSGFSQPVLALPGVAYIVSNGGALFSLGLLP